MTLSKAKELAYDKQSVHLEPNHASGVNSVATIYCTGCKRDVQARLTNGQELYPHRPDLYELPFWECDTCGGYVGCHHKTATPTKPLGFIGTPAIFDARKKIHALLDPLWKSGHIKRGQAYAHISKQLGRPYHTGEIKDLHEAATIWRIVAELHNEIITKATDSPLGDTKLPSEHPTSKQANTEEQRENEDDQIN